MPRQPEWFQQLPAAIDALQEVSAPVVDRAMLETLLGIHRRTAIRLMERFGGYQSGRTFLIARDTLLQALQRVEGGADFQFETGRRERLRVKLDDVQRHRKARSVKIPMAPDIYSRQIEGLPSTIRLAPGKLEISCTDPTDLLQQLMELAQAISNDLDGFERRLQGKLK